MKFRLRPILSEIKELYLIPDLNLRFKKYLEKLQGQTKGDLVLPISGFNPMAKDYMIQKIEELEHIQAEKIMQETINDFNLNFQGSVKDEIVVVLNIADDLKGQWTNFYTADFDSKFKLNAFVKRKFCVPYFWTSETYTKEIVQLKTLEYLNRTVYRFSNVQPKTLEEHFEQEVFVAKNTIGNDSFGDNSKFENMDAFYTVNKNTDRYDLIFNFFYGDKGSENLSYKKYISNAGLGYTYAKMIGLKRRNA